MVGRFLDTMPRDQCPLHGSVSAEDRHKARVGHCLNCGACIYAFSGRELPAQLLDRRRQTRNLILLSADQGDQLPVFTGWRVSVRARSRSIRICPADRNASAEAANQLRSKVAWISLSAFKMEDASNLCRHSSNSESATSV